MPKCAHCAAEATTIVGGAAGSLERDVWFSVCDAHIGKQRIEVSISLLRKAADDRAAGPVDRIAKAIEGFRIPLERIAAALSLAVSEEQDCSHIRSLGTGERWCARCGHVFEPGETEVRFREGGA